MSGNSDERGASGTADQDTTRRTADGTRPTRRTILRGLGGAGVTTVLGVGTMSVLSQPALAVSFTAASTTITTESGQVTDVYVQPQNLEYSWDGLDSDPATMTFTIYVDGPSQNGSSQTGTSLANMAMLGSESDGDISSSSTEGYAGSDSYSFTSQYSLIEHGPWTQDKFKNTSDGTTSTVQEAIEVAVQGELTTANETYTHTRRDTFSVDVENKEAGTTGSGGNAGVGGRGL